MQAEIIPELIIKNLRAVPSKKPDKHLKELEKLSPGAAYLYRKVIIPKLDGKTVNTSELDIDDFMLFMKLKKEHEEKIKEESYV